MPNKKNAEFVELSSDDLQFELQSAQAKLSKLRFDHSATGLENPLVLVEVRRDIARIKTELRKREIAAMGAEELAGRSKIRARRKK